MIEELEIVKYKGFKNLKLNNLSQINIISGENNIGKTALLEALFLSEDISWGASKLCALQSFSFLAESRDTTEHRIKKYLRNIDFSIEIETDDNCKGDDLSMSIKHKSVFHLNEIEEKKIKEDFNQDYQEFLIGYREKKLYIEPITNVSLENKYIRNIYINSSKPMNKSLVTLYSKIQSKGIQHKFLSYLKLLDKDIEWIEPQLLDDEMLLRINLNNPERSLVSSELGEGTNRYIEILATLLSNRGGTVFIDEVENGIHYTKLYDIWKAIIEIVEKEEIQLFVTTHNLESIQALNDASEAMKFNKIASIKLQKDKDNSIYPVIRNYSSFVATVNSGMDIR